MFKIPPARSRESGNVFLIILIGVVLFAALAFTVSRGMRSENTSAMSERDLELSATDILSYMQRVERAVSTMRRASVSETDISFESDLVAANGNCASSACKVFNPDGGHIQWQNFPASVTLDAGVDQRWQFTGQQGIPGIGTDGADPTNSDLLMILEGLPEDLCTKINTKMTGNSTMPVMNDVFDTATIEPYDGTYGGGEVSVASGPDITGKGSYCVKNGALYMIYQVLIAR